jgi:UDP-N-acetyl-2-amino-2-deoxyglucuronate dehydrogenase
MSSISKIKFAVIGCGFAGKKHATLIQRNPEAELVALCDILPKSTLGLDEFEEIPFYNDITDLLTSGLEIDIVSICTPNGLHAEQAIIALEHHKHVIVEKPMGLSKAQCEQIIFKSLNYNRQVFCVMQNRYSPPSQWLKEIIENKLLGELFMVQINCFWNRDDRYYFPEGRAHSWKGNKSLDGGTLFTQFSHFIDMMYWLFGDIKNIHAKFDNFAHKNLDGFEDSGIVNFDFENEGMGSLQYSTAVFDKNMESSLTVIGSNGTVKVGGQYMNEVSYCHIKNYVMPELPESNPANDYGNYKGSAANHVYVIQNAIDVLKGRKSITTNALEGMKVVEIIEKIYRLKNL